MLLNTKMLCSQGGVVSNLYPNSQQELDLYSVDKYPAKKDELRAMTIAGFRVIQNSRQLDKREMQTNVMRFLLSPKAISYWKSQGWLTPKGRTEFVSLTDEGLSVCSESLHDNAATNTSEPLIASWESIMLTGGTEHLSRKTFSQPFTRT
jgi:hypothetical protein